MSANVSSKNDIQYNTIVMIDDTEQAIKLTTVKERDKWDYYCWTVHVFTSDTV